MVYWGLIPGSVVGTTVRTTYAPYVAYMPFGMRELNMDFLGQGGTAFPPFNWKTVQHWKVEGTYYVNSSDQDLTGGAFLAYANGRRAQFVACGSTSVWYVTNNATTRTIQIVVTQPVKSTGNVCGSWYVRASWRWTYNRPTKKYVWQMSDAHSSGFADWYIQSSFPAETSIDVMVPTFVGDLSKTAPVRAEMRTVYSTGKTYQVEHESQVKALIRHCLCQVIGRAERELATRLESLHATSFDTLQKFDGNLVLLLTKLASGIGTSTLQSVYQLATSEGNLRDIASFWLASNYGDKLSASGFAKLVKSADREFLSFTQSTTPWLRGSSRQSATFLDEDGLARDETYGCGIAVRPKDYNTLMRAIRSAYEWDWYPSMSNVWDAIPLSFVVDWFVNVGDIYRSVDRMIASRYYEVGKTLNSVKSTAHSPLTPGLTYTYYTRYTTDSLHLSVDSVRVGLPSFVNCINGGALLLG